MEHTIEKSCESEQKVAWKVLWKKKNFEKKEAELYQKGCTKMFSNETESLKAECATNESQASTEIKAGPVVVETRSHYV